MACTGCGKKKKGQFKVTNYAAGADFERYVLDVLDKQGYYVARVAGSHTPCDVIAFNETALILIQCKSSRIDCVPDLKQLLARTEMKQSKVNTGIIKYKVKQLERSNVVLLEEMPTPYNLYSQTVKLILWKGAGRDNYFNLRWSGTRWICAKGLRI